MRTVPDFEDELGKRVGLVFVASGAAMFRDGPARVANCTGQVPDLVDRRGS